ncbi:hypothetical protein, partial [Aeromonas salmonicida]|uniref:hypothetical protein n=1 Tax=Aeromonas salmonicida TaxID=645 RepID=UPI003D312BC5
ALDGAAFVAGEKEHQRGEAKGAVSFLQIRAPETIPKKLFDVVFLKKKKKNIFINKTKTTKIYTAWWSSAPSDVYKRQVKPDSGRSIEFHEPLSR